MDDLTGHHHTGDHRAYQELLGAYALGAVGQEEARALAAHVATCPACRAELARLRAAVTALPLTIAERDLPPISRYRLEARLLNDLAQPAPPLLPSQPARAAPRAHPAQPGWPDTTLQPAWPTPADATPAAPAAWAPRVPSNLPGQTDLATSRPAVAGALPVSSPASLASPPLTPDRAAAGTMPPRLRRLPLVWLGVAAVLAIVAAGLLVWNLDLRQDLDEREPPAAVALVPEQAAEGASATMTYLDDAGVMVIALHGAPPPGANEVYQLWLVHDTVVIPFGVFDKETAECAVVVDPALYQQVIITREPGPFGSPSAVGPAILVAPLGTA